MAAESVLHVVGAGGEEDEADLVVGLAQLLGSVNAGHFPQINVHEHGNVEIGAEIGEEAFPAGEGPDGKLLPMDGGVFPDLPPEHLPGIRLVVNNGDIHYNMSPLSQWTIDNYGAASRRFFW